MGLPEEIGEAEVTSLCYNANFILYTATNSGRVCVWDCNTHRCFMTWEADDGEIGERNISVSAVPLSEVWKKFRVHAGISALYPTRVYFSCVGVLLCRGNRLLTGSNSKKLKLWAVAAVQNLRPSSTRTSSHNG